MSVFRRAATTSFLMVAVFAVSAVLGQQPGDGSPTQRLEVMRQKLETIRRSATSAASVLKQEGKEEGKEVKENLDTPYARLKAIEKEASNLQSEVNSLRGRVDRSDKYEASDIDQIGRAHV